MTYHSLVHHFQQLLSGDVQAWRYLPYRLGMKMRRIDLGWVSAKDSGLPVERCHWHSNSGGPDLERLLNTLSISRSDAVLDIGCGKGGAMLTMARYPFSRVDGVEISPNLVRVARANLQRLGIQNATVFCSDAADFANLDPYTYLYMYNPFPEEVMNVVLENIVVSLRRQERQLTLIYKNPICNIQVLNTGFRKVDESHQTHPDYPPFRVYVADGTSI